MGRVKLRKLKDVREERIQKALEAFRSGQEPSLRAAAESYGILKTTLCNRYNNQTGTRQEANRQRQLLSPAQEDVVVAWIQKLDDWGFPPRLDMVRGMAEMLARPQPIGKHWLSRFLNRHPELSSKYSEQLNRQRALAGNPKVLNDYFRKLRHLIRIHDLQPDQIYNMDEKGFLMGQSAKAKVICRTRRRNPRVTQDGSREMITVIESVNASGFVLPPFIIYKGTGHYMGWYQFIEPEEASFAYSSKGWTDEKLALRWLKDIFEFKTQRKDGKPRLLILDGHGSHITWEFCSFCLDNDIILLCLPAHTTHLLQPLDVGLFSPLQHYYGKAVDNLIRDDTDLHIKKANFFPLLRQAHSQAFTVKNIKSAFQATGIVPYNPRTVLSQLQWRVMKSPLRVHIPKPPAAGWASRCAQFIHTIFPQTPHNNRELRRATQRALQNLDAESLGRSVVKKLVLKLAHIAEGTMATAEIEAEAHRQLRLKPKMTAKQDRRKLSKAQVITTKDVIRLKEEKEEKERKKKGQKRPNSKSNPNSASAPILQTPQHRMQQPESEQPPSAPKPRRQVRIASPITVIALRYDSDSEDSDEWCSDVKDIIKVPKVLKILIQ